MERINGFLLAVGALFSHRFSVAPCAGGGAGHTMGSRTLGMSGRSAAEVLLTIEERKWAGKNAAIQICRRLDEAVSRTKKVGNLLKDRELTSTIHEKGRRAGD